MGDADFYAHYGYQPKSNTGAQRNSPVPRLNLGGMAHPGGAGARGGGGRGGGGRGGGNPYPSRLSAATMADADASMQAPDAMSKRYGSPPPQRRQQQPQHRQQQQPRGGGGNPYPSRLSAATMADADASMQAPDAMSKRYGSPPPQRRQQQPQRSQQQPPQRRQQQPQHRPQQQPQHRPQQGGRGSPYPSRLSAATMADADASMRAPDAMSKRYGSPPPQRHQQQPQHRQQQQPQRRQQQQPPQRQQQQPRGGGGNPYPSRLSAATMADADASMQAPDAMSKRYGSPPPQRRQQQPQWSQQQPPQRRQQQPQHRPQQQPQHRPQQQPQHRPQQGGRGSPYPSRLSAATMADADASMRAPDAMSKRYGSPQRGAPSGPPKYPPRLSPEAIRDADALRRGAGDGAGQQQQQRPRQGPPPGSVKYPPRLSPENQPRTVSYPPRLNGVDAELEAQFKAEEAQLRRMQKQHEAEQRRRYAAERSGARGGQQAQGQAPGRSAVYPPRLSPPKHGEFQGSPNYPPRLRNGGGSPSRYTRTLSRTSSRSPAPGGRPDPYGIDAPFGRQGDAPAPYRASRGRPTKGHPSRASSGNPLSHQEHDPYAASNMQIRARAGAAPHNNLLAGEGERGGPQARTGRRLLNPPGSHGAGPPGAYPGSGNEPNAHAYGAGGAYGEDVGSGRAHGRRQGFAKPARDLAPKIGERPTRFLPQRGNRY